MNSEANTDRIHDVNINSLTPMLPPSKLLEELPITDSAKATVMEGRQTVRNIIARTDPRIMMVIGPCSIHDPEAAMDYARRLKKLSDQVSDSIYVVMRVYFEKPRTTTGWKGLINDPDMNCLLYTSPSPRDQRGSRMPSSA